MGGGRAQGNGPPLPLVPPRRHPLGRRPPPRRTPFGRRPQRSSMVEQEEAGEDGGHET